MDVKSLQESINKEFDATIIPTLCKYISIPNVSPAFDASALTNGLMDQAVDLMVEWVKAQNVEGLHLEVVRLEGRTPLIFIEVAGTAPGGKSLLMYGHLDKQPPFEGWEDGLGPYSPVIRGDKLYGRGGADDGYAIFSSVLALKELKARGVPHARTVIIIEACEESGSFDLPHYVEHLKARIGNPDLIVCLDSGCGNYETLWATTSLRGMIAGDLTVSILNEGVHSGDASGIVPDSFRILRQILSRIEDEETGEVKIKELHCEIPAQRAEQAALAAKELGPSLYKRFPFVDSAVPTTTELVTASLNRTWRPALSVTGAGGLPTLPLAGNVLRPNTAVKLSMRIPPKVDAKMAALALKRDLEANPPYNARVTFDIQKEGSGWEAPPLAPWLEAAAESASTAVFGHPCRYIGEGGSIPFMGMLGEKFPAAQFFIAGVLGPASNAHGPNESLSISYCTRLTACITLILASHASA